MEALSLPKTKKKKKIDVNRFIKRARELKKYFEEEAEYLRRREIENEHLLSGKSF